MHGLSSEKLKTDIPSQSSRLFFMTEIIILNLREHPNYTNFHE